MFVPLIDAERVAVLPERCVENLHSDADGERRKLHLQFVDGRFVFGVRIVHRSPGKLPRRHLGRRLGVRGGRHGAMELSGRPDANTSGV